jgi:two-component system NtrC family sensor kinase
LEQRDAELSDRVVATAEALEEKNTALMRAQAQVTEALEQQTATSEILRIISSSPTDVQPVFDAIAKSIVRLCGSLFSAVYTLNGESMRLVAHHNFAPATLKAMEAMFPARPGRETAAGRAILDRAIVQIEDVLSDPDYGKELQATAGWRSTFAVPMRREGMPIGAIAAGWAEPGPASTSNVALLKTFADQAVIAVENVRLFNELRTSNRELTTALDTQTATSDILRVISRSQTDVQPVFDAIVQSAVRLLRSGGGVLTRKVGDQIELGALVSDEDAAAEAALRAVFPLHLQSAGIHAAAIRTCVPVNIPDAHTDPRLGESGRTHARVRGYQSIAVVPLLRQDEAVGTVAVSRTEPGGFTDDEIALLKTFADQAVIAIENVRLFTELQAKNTQLTESLERQNATGEILRVISSSPADILPVLDAVATSSARLCEALDATILLRDGDAVVPRTHSGSLGAPFGQRQRITRDWVTGRAILEGRTIHVPDLLQSDEFPEGRQLALRYGHRATLVVPLLREGIALGAILVRRREPFPFSDKQIVLLQTFADQAAIAIENVRLFTELQEKNRALTKANTQVTEALERQTATSEILRVISSAHIDPQPVFDAIVRNAARLCHAGNAAVFLTDGRMVYEPANLGGSAEARAATRARFPRPVGMDSTAGIAILTRSVFHVPDVDDPSVLEHTRQSGRLIGFRSVVTVPMLREGEAVGAILVARPEPGRFSDAEVALLQTFADQAVIAIENVRLFKELEAANRDLAAASQHKSEFLASMSHELRTPLNAVIGFSDVLLQGMFGETNEKQTEYLRDILASGQHLLSLINDILDLSKIEAGRMELDVADFHLPSAIDDALLLMRERAGRRGITLERRVDERVGEIRGDQRKVKQVLLNLLSNAVKFTPEGGRIDVRAALANGTVEISVTDTGVGIAPEDHEAVFEEFRQVGASEKKAEGTGLGLALCRKFVELHGGRIWVISEIAKGSTFTFTIPVADPPVSA